MVPDTQTYSTASRATPAGNLPSVIPDTSDLSRSVSPADLQADSQPVRRLRKDQKTSTAADQFLKDIGYLSSQGNSSSESSPADGLWPEDYVDRLTGNEPTFDSLKLSEFISGYISIMEETLPRGVDLAALRRHFSYLRSLMVDCSKVDWVMARTAHKQVLLGIHYRRFTWLDQRACVDAKRDAIQRMLRIPREAVPKALPAPEVIITPLPPLSVGELSVRRRAHHRWDYLHPLLRLLPTERGEKARTSGNQLQQKKAGRREEGKKRQTQQEEPQEIGLKPSPTAPHKRPTGPRTPDLNRQGRGQIHRVVSHRETASTDDPFKTTDFTSQAYDPIVDEALANAPHPASCHAYSHHRIAPASQIPFAHRCSRP